MRLLGWRAMSINDLVVMLGGAYRFILSFRPSGPSWQSVSLKPRIEISAESRATASISTKPEQYVSLSSLSSLKTGTWKGHDIPQGDDSRDRKSRQHTLYIVVEYWSFTYGSRSPRSWQSTILVLSFGNSLISAKSSIREFRPVHSTGLGTPSRAIGSFVCTWWHAMIWSSIFILASECL